MSKKDNEFYLTKAVRVSQALYDEVKKYAEPLEDNFESACWKILKKIDKK